MTLLKKIILIIHSPTNGVCLRYFVDLFKNKKYVPRDIQVTIDGPKEIHDKRRIAKGGKGSFDDIVESIDVTVEAGIHISLRLNIDDMNVNYINQIADFIISKKWANKNNFTAYLAPVTDHSSVNQNYPWLIVDSSLVKRR